MILPSLDRKILALAILSIALVPAWAQSPKQAMTPASRQKDFERQWKEVRTKDPLVAMAYQELALAALAPANSRSLVVQTLCQDPRFAKSPGCHKSPGSPSGSPCPPPCKPPLNEQGIEGYLSCLDQQIACQL